MQLTNPNVIPSQLPLQINDHTSVLCKLFQRQNEIATLLIQQQTAHLLPPREIPFFDGILCSIEHLSEPLNIVWRATPATKGIVCISWTNTQEVSQKS